MIRLSLPLPTASHSLKHNPNSRRKIPSARPHNPAVAGFKSLNSRMIRHADAGRLGEAPSSLDLMSSAGAGAGPGPGPGPCPDLTSYSVLLQSCIRTRNLETGRAVHSKLIESGIKLDAVVLNSLISLYSKCGDRRKAEEIFSSMGGLRNLVSWRSMISCYEHGNLNSQAISTFLKMVELGERPDEICFATAIRACSNLEFCAVGLVIFGLVMKTGHFGADVRLGCALIDLFTKGFGDLDSARKVFDKMPVRDLISWTLMITRFKQMGSPRDSILLFLDMIYAGFVPDWFTLSCCLSAGSELGLLAVGRQLHTWVIKNGFLCNICVGCGLVDMYSKCAVNRSMDEARKIFDQMQDHDVMSWTAVITGYVQSGGHDYEAIELYCRMITEGEVKPDHFTFSSLLKACRNLFNLRLSKQIYGHAVKLGLTPVNDIGGWDNLTVALADSDCGVSGLGILEVGLFSVGYLQLVVLGVIGARLIAGVIDASDGVLTRVTLVGARCCVRVVGATFRKVPQKAVRDLRACKVSCVCAMSLACMTLGLQFGLVSNSPDL
ncbi:Pentatricopeptide repeat-containing protein -chloroplastic [Striga hermonthica]|uniref:Pentatricopeptide repeat-containing protein -chloroplastic n=1 Tax=Striga hermonthica TaxID=68872 RepID=A0A9N7N209_STRHE|nr:Pentatricopeptide repeat-containing protein -chloroplastic [Striga hermonthica]